MALVVDRRADLRGGAGTHALICGIGTYPYVHTRSQSSSRFSFDLPSIPSAVRTAASIYRWLIERFHNPRAPLATCRLLLTPGGEDPAEVNNDIADAEVPTLDNFLRAAYGWRDDAASHPDGMAICYIAGHGISMGAQDHAILMHDFADGFGSILYKSISTLSLWRGMAPAPDWPDVARTQLYFIDSGRSLRESFPGSQPTEVFDPAIETLEEQVALVFTASALGATPLGQAEGTTPLGRALLECLSGAAAAPVGEGKWGVTTDRLVRMLPDRVRRDSPEHGVRQDCTVSGLLRRSELIVELAEPPPADVRIEIPASLSAVNSISVLDSELKPVASIKGPFPPGLVRFTVPPGVYLIEANTPGKPTIRMLVTVDVPSTDLVLQPVS